MLSCTGWPIVSVIVFGVNWYSVRITVLVGASCAHAADTHSVFSASSPAITVNGNERVTSRARFTFSNMVHTSCSRLIQAPVPEGRSQPYRLSTWNAIALPRHGESSSGHFGKPKELALLAEALV